MKLGELWALTLVISNALPASGGQEGSQDLQTQVLRRRDTHSLCPGGPPAPHKDTT